MSLVNVDLAGRRLGKIRIITRSVVDRNKPKETLQA